MSAARSRRGVLAGAGGAAAALALLAVGPAGNAVNPDAELIRLCEEFNEMQRQYLDYFPGGQTVIEDDDERLEVLTVLNEPQEKLLGQILDLQATTPAGFMARARMYYAYMGEEVFDTENVEGWDKLMVAALVRDMVGEARDEA